MRFTIRFSKNKYTLITLSDYFSSVQDTETAKMSSLHTLACSFVFFFFFLKTFIIVEASKPISERAKVDTSH